jgi:hypothetical protein
MVGNGAVRLGDWQNAVDLVGNIKAAIQKAAGELAAKRLEITKAEVDLVIHTTLAGGLKLDVGGIGGEAGHTRDTIHTLHISLVPKPAPTTKGIRPDITDDLALAIPVIAGVMQKAVDAEPRFDLDEATVSLVIKVDTNGKISLLASAEGTAGGAGTVVLTIKPAT